MTGVDPDLVRPLAAPHRGALRGRSTCETKVERVERAGRRPARALRGREARPRPPSSTACSSRSGGAPNGDAHRRRARGRAGRRARLHPGRRRAAHQRRRTSSRSATSPARRCSRTGDAPGQGRGGGDRGPAGRVRRAACPSVAYTDPEIAWVGLTEERARRARASRSRRRCFPWSATGRALGIDRSEGLTKLLSTPETGRLLGAGIVGAGAGELIAEATLALEMGADVEDSRSPSTRTRRSPRRSASRRRSRTAPSRICCRGRSKG